jgi:prevent-host-death family protein
MRTINIHEAKTHLSRLVDEAVQGEPFVIAKRGKPAVIVTQVPVTDAQKKRLLGSLRGVYTLPDNFEEIEREMDKEIEKLFLGEDQE